MHGFEAVAANDLDERVIGLHAGPRCAKIRRTGFRPLPTCAIILTEFWEPRVLNGQIPANRGKRSARR
ncbi:hypothetical protein JANAI62_32560 [Jannaschia pagri]|uniref:Uncharacterized protein n=1 Tax=Jannaschia pagri TaxID=2829797 RepID=A0ABQ4NQI6_9RHOB|nr:hypothetical protein JANAI61_32560 [Jannaschia sp. AI_61]GIT96633.1 hypothetical protein JANAI62_32560 [Jannaschia sp. AI_62]